jgi:hypothetical protein
VTVRETCFFGTGFTLTQHAVLLVLNQVFIAMYIFELIFRTKLSPVAVMHHIGSVTIAATAVAISLDWEHQQDATIEFILCYVWGRTCPQRALLSSSSLTESAGMFDVLAEFWPHVAIILYRMHPTEHNYLRKVFLSAGIITCVGTVVETVAVMYLWGWAWDRWTLAFKVVTPILHVIFSAAQLWGAYNFYKMWQSQKRLMRADKDDVEHGAVALEVVQPKSSTPSS